DAQPGSAHPAPLSPGSQSHDPCRGKRTPPLSALSPRVSHPGRLSHASRRGSRTAAWLRQPRTTALPASADVLTWDKFPTCPIQPDKLETYPTGGEVMPAHRLYVGTIGEGVFRSLDG